MFYRFFDNSLFSTILPPPLSSAEEPPSAMKILFLCTAHNSLSQRLYLALHKTYDITIEYALSDDVMISAADMVKPDLIVCPFLTARVPRAIYDNYLTLIVHPGPPGDVGPSSLDWVLAGDDGSIEDHQQLLLELDKPEIRPGRSHWGVSVLQAIEEFDAGPIWAFEQFPIDIDQPGLTKSELYRGPVSRAAISAVKTAIDRIHKAALENRLTSSDESTADYAPTSNRSSLVHISPHLQARPEYMTLSTSQRIPFQGGPTRHRPLLKAAQRDVDVSRHSAQQISRRIRCGDSQPGSLSTVFGPKMYVYGGVIEERSRPDTPQSDGPTKPGSLIAIRNEAVCFATCDGQGIWISHIRRVKTAKDAALWPKVPAVSGLVDLGILDATTIARLRTDSPATNWQRASASTFQEVWVEFESYQSSKLVAYLHFDFYNGAMSTRQCSLLIEAMDHIIEHSTTREQVCAVVLMGGAYFSNGIALNVIEAAQSPSMETWLNINRIDDVVHHLLHEFPSRNILTIAGLRGNAAAGGVALATACDLVVAGSEVVLNPAYRGIGLYGSEYHTVSYPGRCGSKKAAEILRSMTPLSPYDARSIGLVDHVLPGTGVVLDKRIRNHVAAVVRSEKLKQGLWKLTQDMSPAALAHARTLELNEMSKDIYSARSIRYHSRRFNFVRKVKPRQTPVRFATHRRLTPDVLDEEERDAFDDVVYYEDLLRSQLLAHFQKQLSLKSVTSTVEVGAARDVKDEPSQVLFPCYYQAVF